MVSNLVGARVLSITGASRGSEEVVITTDRGALKLWHDSECCEWVRVEEVDGDPGDLVGRVVSIAEETQDGVCDGGGDRHKWTFYRLCTDGGDLTLRWLGGDNGYYSVDVDVEWTEVRS